jgi:hypothetical protein
MKKALFVAIMCLAALQERSQCQTNRVISVRDYGCAGDGVTDDTTCLTKAGNAVKSAAASGPVTFLFPTGTYVANPLDGMVPWATGATGNQFFNFGAANNITVQGQGATIQMATPATP